MLFFAFFNFIASRKYGQMKHTNFILPERRKITPNSNNRGKKRQLHCMYAEGLGMMSKARVYGGGKPQLGCTLNVRLWSECEGKGLNVTLHVCYRPKQGRWSCYPALLTYHKS